MKTIFYMLLVLSLLACKGSQDQKKEPLTPEEEQAIVDSVSIELDQAKSELSSSTQKKVAEIDSLLEKL